MKSSVRDEMLDIFYCDKKKLNKLNKKKKFDVYSKGWARLNCTQKYRFEMMFRGEINLKRKERNASHH